MSPEGFKIRKLEFTTLNCGSSGSSDSTLDETYALFGDDVISGDDYLTRFYSSVETAIKTKSPLPIVRFADGEFALYSRSIRVNGLYEQTRTVEEIDLALPYHIESLKYISKNGRICPITYLYNISFVNYDDCKNFYTFLSGNGIDFNPNNYWPFYMIYGALTSVAFMNMIDQKNVLIISDEFDQSAVAAWTSQFHVTPNYKFAQIPSRWVAVHYHSYIKNGLLAAIKNLGDIDIALVAAGAGAAPVCADISQTFNIPAIDTGHVLNLMNNKVSRSGGHRIFTFKGIYK